eukprot:TCALIF_11833-PA protein Name:"Similar to RARS2 Probable arginine--tRNA ligase, mitochondrial (Homo sapiens)" AED:0.03 eAED:0.03 QI:0/-1/0/1/-1/1/1/0/586
MVLPPRVNTSTFSIQVPCSSVLEMNKGSSSSLTAYSQALSGIVEEFETDCHLPEIVLVNEPEMPAKPRDKKGKWVPSQGPSFNFRLPTLEFTKDVLHVALKVRTKDWRRNGLFPQESPLKVIVEFSSPNVAKPFHMGHLRSTIMGHFCANIYEAVGHDVIRLNWLGDWGTQFGYISAGLKDFALDINQVQSENDAIHSLYQIYVQANLKGEKDPKFASLVRECTEKLENGDSELLKQWSIARKVTIESLEKVYARLGVYFHEYHGESMYTNQANQKVLDLMRTRNLLADRDGKQVIPMTIGKNQLERDVTILKTDGSSLYITRDIAAAIDRAQKYAFDRMLYVVENGQTEHFQHLFAILKRLGFSWSAQLEHVKFGRISKMSSRKGTAVFLNDILDEAKDRVREQRELSPNTRDVLDSDDVLEVLGTTAVVVNDFSSKRLQNYDFSWERAVKSTGTSGVRLQYTHCRLFSLISKENHSMSSLLEVLEEDSRFLAGELTEKEAQNLLWRIAVFDEAVRDAYIQLEPNALLRYLFALCSDISKALKCLSVQNAESDAKRLARLCLFGAAKSVLKEGLEILGIRVLNQM